VSTTVLVSLVLNMFKYSSDTLPAFCKYSCTVGFVGKGRREK
jgi:hypothetical protein